MCGWPSAGTLNGGQGWTIVCLGLNFQKPTSLLRLSILPNKKDSSPLIPGSHYRAFKFSISAKVQLKEHFWWWKLNSLDVTSHWLKGTHTYRLVLAPSSYILSRQSSQKAYQRQRYQPPEKRGLQSQDFQLDSLTCPSEGWAIKNLQFRPKALLCLNLGMPLRTIRVKMLCHHGVWPIWLWFHCRIHPFNIQTNTYPILHSSGDETQPIYHLLRGVPALSIIPVVEFRSGSHIGQPGHEKEECFLRLTQGFCGTLEQSGLGRSGLQEWRLLIIKQFCTYGLGKRGH